MPGSCMSIKDKDDVDKDGHWYTILWRHIKRIYRVVYALDFYLAYAPQC